jgi:hypothetical protein
MANFFYYDTNGQKQGLFTSQEVKALAEQGIITPGTALESDSGHRGVASQIKGLFPVVPASSQNYGTTVQPQSPAVPMTAQGSFAARCPEVDLSVIPVKWQAEFIQQYEARRPQLRGNDAIVYLTEQEILLDPSLEGLQIERTHQENLGNGIAIVGCRVKNAGQGRYQQWLMNYKSAFVVNFLHNSEANQARATWGVLGGLAVILLPLFGWIWNNMDRESPY